MAMFKELKAEMENILRDPEHQSTIYYFDFISWIESKIRNRPFAEVVQEWAALPYQ